MSSSTSNFRNAKVAAVVICLVLAAELGFRASLRLWSFDDAHIDEIPAISSRLAAAAGLKVLFLGNSLTRAGVDVNEFRAEINSRMSQPFAVERVFPDDTRIGEWYHAFRHYFVDQKRVPDIVVLGFVSRQIEDFRKMDPSRLGSVYGGIRDIPEIFTNDLHDLDDRVEYLLAFSSKMFANRTRVKRRVLDAVIPDYRNSAQRVNDSMRVTESAVPAGHAATYTRLKRFLNLASQNNVRVVVVAMPLPDDYDTDPNLVAAVQSAGMVYLDCRRVSGMRPEHFPDRLHLDAEGAKLYTRALAAQMGAIKPVTLLSTHNRAATPRLHP